MNHTRYVAGPAALAVSLLATAGAMSLPAGASTAQVVGSPSKGLLTAAQAGGLGFTKTVDKPVSTSKTGVRGCTKGAQAVFEDAAGKTGLISEVLVCKSASQPANIIKKAKATGPAVASMSPPKQLGASAIERASDAETHVMYWQRGRVLALVAIDTNVPASSSSTTTTPKAASPLTAKQQATFAKAALEQDASIK